MLTKAQADAWREAAIADGWDVEPLYDCEEVERAAKLTKQGWVIFVFARTPEPGHKWKTNTQCEVAAWGPDRLHVDTPDVYDPQVLECGLRHCGRCNRDNVDVTRVGFAGRYCHDCVPEERKVQEFPGWTR